MKLITIITVSKNSEKYIGDCIKSVVNQCFDDFEYIIIDSASTDATVDIIKKHNNKIDYWVSEADRNISDAFNKGINKANGKWIIFLNSDDYFCSASVLSQMAEYLCKYNNYDVIYGKINLIKRSHNQDEIIKTYGPPWSWEQFRFRSTIPHPACFTNINYFNTYGLFDLSYTNALDYELFLRKGPDLKVTSCDIVVTNMRVGGMSNKYALLSMLQSRHAQIKNKSLPTISAYANWIYMVVKVSIKKAVSNLSN